MFPTISLGRLAIPTQPLIFVLGVYAALNAFEWAARRVRLHPSAVAGTASLALLGGMAAARLAFVGRFWSLYAAQPLAIIWPLTSGYVAWVGWAAGGLILLAMARRSRLPLWSLADALAPGLIIFLAALSLGDWLGGPGLGLPTDRPWGLRVVDVRRHPVQAYELIVLAAAFWAWLRPRDPHTAEPGRRFLLALSWAAIGRLFTEAFRLQSPLLAGFRLPQLVALALALVASAVLARRAPAAEAPKPT